MLAGSIACYNADVDAGEDTHFGKAATFLEPIRTAPFYAVELRPSTVCSTAYGLRIDRDARVLAEDSWPIPGLYAAGECTGGVVGAQYVGSGNNYANVTVFGRIAGDAAAGAGRCVGADRAGSLSRTGPSASSSRRSPYIALLHAADHLGDPREPLGEDPVDAPVERGGRDGARAARARQLQTDDTGLDVRLEHVERATVGGDDGLDHLDHLGEVAHLTIRCWVLAGDREGAGRRFHVPIQPRPVDFHAIGLQIDRTGTRTGDGIRSAR